MTKAKDEKYIVKQLTATTVDELEAADETDKPWLLYIYDIESLEDFFIKDNDTHVKIPKQKIKLKKKNWRRNLQ